MTRASPASDELHPEGLYLSPGGRACRLAPHQSADDLKREAHLVYDTPGGQAGQGTLADGFVLARSNWYLLRRLA